MRKLLLIVPLLAAVVVAGCIGQTTTPPPSSNSIDIKNFAFNPSEITVNKGTTVTWTNDDSTQHTVTSDSGAFDSGQLRTGQTFSFTFNNPGTFKYHCSNHPSMTASVVVTA